jgi:hypothetical protein
LSPHITQNFFWSHILAITRDIPQCPMPLVYFPISFPIALWHTWNHSWHPFVIPSHSPVAQK